MQESLEPVLEETPEMEPAQRPDGSEGSDPRAVLSSDRTRERKFRAAIAAYGVLAVLIWFTVGAGTVRAFGRPVEIRLIPLLIVGTFAFRTYVAREADKIRGRG
jgi:hypothetical protein